MHFWIDKRSQGCGFRSPLVPGYGRNQRYIGSLYPKPMVTPIHRFHCMSLPSNGGRYDRTRGSFRLSPHILHNNSTITDQSSQEMIAINLSHLPPRSGKPISKLKCGMWFGIVLIAVLFACAKYYFHFKIGVESYAFGSLILITLMVIGLVFLCRAVVAVAYTPGETSLPHNIDQVDQLDPLSNPVPTSPMPATTTEMSPPPYHIAVMLPQQQDAEAIQIMRDSPPPTYEKAVT